MEGDASHERPSTRVGANAKDESVGLFVFGGAFLLSAIEGWNSSRLPLLSTLRGWRWGEGGAGRLALGFKLSSFRACLGRRGMKSSKSSSLDSAMVLLPRRKRMTEGRNQGCDSSITRYSNSSTRGLFRFAFITRRFSRPNHSSV